METYQSRVKSLPSASGFNNIYKDCVINLIKGLKKYPCLWLDSHPDYHNNSVKDTAYNNLVKIWNCIEPAATKKDVKRKLELLRTSFRREYKKGFKNCPCLWLDSHPDYHRKKAKDMAYNNLVKIWNCIEPDATKKDVKRKLHGLRTNFRREHKKVLERECAGELYTPTLWYFNQFLFLINRDEVNFSDSDSDNTHESSPPPKRRATESIDYNAQLQDLPEDQRDIAKRLISEVIHYGKTGQLTLDTSLVIIQTVDQNNGDNEQVKNDETASAVNFMQEEMDRF